MNKLFRLISILALTVGLSATANAVAVSGQGTWETTLQARDLDGNLATTEAYYDTVLGITWLADANAAGTTMTWDTANNTWAAGLTLGGYTDWRLPTMVDTGTSGCNFAYSDTDCGYNVQTTGLTTVYSEMASMFYDTLGNKAYFDTAGNPAQPGWGLTNTGLFSNLQSDYYWSATWYAPTNTAWGFNMPNGLQYHSNEPSNFYAWAVHSGDVGVAVSAVPIPAAVWLLGSGLIGLVGMARRKKS